jgi:hypothetical protein
MVNIGPTLPVSPPMKPTNKATTATVVVSKQAQKVPVTDRRKQRERRNGRHNTTLELRAGRERRKSLTSSIDTSC